MADDLGTKVRYSSIEEMARVLRALAKDTRNDLARMDQAIKKVTETWDGEAKAKYLDLQKKYTKRAEDIERRLSQIANLMDSGKDKYRATDKKSSALFTESF
ncbi:hypothetical protein BJP40_07040 [Streptomyces sp. CC53]|uniref:WXG100 family type VII secretion target n=1 Tax=unclassified Streptomyces TaxID=2593676 RepID=UPI0008DE8730|nr:MULTISPECIES: WXG100 family type VII secretion target [unclassified Streptomyces]OII61103.1 hypothetical protein BJP40_07040 [Streptomyces sp. CC53]OII69144.1 hypothetical protein BJP39_18620 [Streptomyces sp. CC77]